MTSRLTLSAIALGTALALAGPTRAAEMLQSGEAIDSGVRLQWTYGSQGAPGLGTLDVKLTSETTGAPLSYGRGEILAWLQRDRAALSDVETPCAERVKTLATRGVGRRSDIDLNEYRLMTLNTDGSIAVINPFVGINNAKLEAIIELGSSPKSWLQIPERAELWVLIDGPGQLVAVDLQSRTITRRIELPAGAGANGLAFDASSSTLWVAFPGVGGFGALDLASKDATPRIVPAMGARGVVAAPGLRGVVTFQADGTVDLRRGVSSARSWRVPDASSFVAYSALTKQLIVATREGDLHWLDQDGDAIEPARSLSLGRQIDALVLFDDGRRALVVGDGTASVVDLAVASETLRMAAPKASDIVLTTNFAYAVDAVAGRATLWSLTDLRAGRARPVDVMVGSPDGAPAALPSSFRRATPAPGGGGMLFASAKDGMIFQYGEGMMAPTGSFSNYRRAPLALAILDQSLQPVGAGGYRTAVRHVAGGRYRLALAGDRPRFTACADIDLPNTPQQPEEAANRLRAVLLGAPPVGSASSVGGGPIRIRLESVGPDGAVSARSGVADVSLLLFDRLSGWQRRTRLRETDAGEYSSDVKVPRTARYEVLVSSASQDLSFLEGRVGEIMLGSTP